MASILLGSVVSPTIPTFPRNPDGSTSAALLAAAVYPGQTVQLTPAQIDPIAVNILNLRSNIYGGAFAIPRPGQGGCG